MTTLSRILRRLAVLLMLAVAVLVPTPHSAGALFCGGACNPRYGPGWCPKGCRCYAASTRGFCFPSLP
jgi:hypothetical protein